MAEVLERRFGDRLCPAKLWDHIINTDVDDFDAYSGHFGPWLADHLNRPLRSFTLLRDPVARTVSHYRHVERAVDHPFHRLTAGRSLAEWVRDPRMALMIENYQARYLARVAAPWPLREGLTADQLAGAALQVRFDQATLGVPSHVLQREAEATLDRLAFVGTTEDFLTAASWLGVEPLARANVAPGTPPIIDSETRALIEELTAVDRVLYEAVRRTRRESAEGRIEAA